MNMETLALNMLKTNYYHDYEENLPKLYMHARTGPKCSYEN